MKRLVLAGAAAATLAGSAFAADLPSKKPVYVPPPPVMTWTGFHIGLNAGYTWGGTQNVNYTAFSSAPGGFLSGVLAGQLPTSIAVNNDGFIGGGQVGYDYQLGFAGLGSGAVIGLEADIQGIAGGSRTNNYNYFGPLNPTFTTATRGLDYLGTVRGRLGFLFTPSLLVYGTGGLAYGGAKLSSSFWTAPGFAWGTSFSDTRVGWAAGGGAEWMLMPNWSAKVEYLYYDLGSVTAPAMVSTLGGIFSTYTPRARFDGHVVRAGVNYHFNWGAAPVVAKY